jgi:hypothetical protein
MGEVKRSTEEIQREIERVREDLARNVTALELTVREKLDFRLRIRERPLAFVGGAFAIGFVVGLI